MAKKTSKTTRGDRYAAIMERDGFVPDEWQVLSFVFESESGPERFHYGLLLADPAPGYYLFDCFDNTANVIVPHDDGNAALIQQWPDTNVKPAFTANCMCTIICARIGRNWPPKSGRGIRTTDKNIAI